MKLLNKKRLEKLEKVLNVKKGRPRFAKVIYDASIPNFDLSSLRIDADCILALPDNGMRCLGEGFLPKGTYRISYG